MSIAMPLFSAAIAAWLMYREPKMPWLSGFNAACAVINAAAWFR